MPALPRRTVAQKSLSLEENSMLTIGSVPFTSSMSLHESGHRVPVLLRHSPKPRADSMMDSLLSLEGQEAGT
ncbi:hypothetical protein EC991_005963 [Linnemannia zychae]|nr:hypothetical protein EC991_005963 [Linnemannia zychae]